MLEESFVVVPRLFGRAFGQPRQVFRIGDRLGLLAAALRNFGEQSEIQTLDRLAAFVGQLGADAAFILEARNLMAAGAAVMTNPLLAFFLQLGIVHEGSCGIGGRLLLLLRHQVGGDVLRVFGAQAQAGHHGHVLHLQFVTVVGALAVLQIKLVGQAFLGVILGADVFLLVRTVRTRALAARCESSAPGNRNWPFRPRGSDSRQTFRPAI